MSENLREPDGGPAAPTPEDELAARITSALRSRGGVVPDAADVAARIDARLAALPDRPTLTTATRRGTKAVAAGVVTSALAVAGAGAAAAADPYSDVARTVENVAQAVGIPWSPMPDGYTRDQYDAFWGAGYTAEDVAALGDLWQTDPVAAKARAGQLVLDGQAVPVPPSGAEQGVLVPIEQAEIAVEAFFDAGYAWDDAVALGALWSVEPADTKIRAGQMLLEGEPLPFAPGEGAPPADG